MSAHSFAGQGMFSHGSGAVVLKGQRQDLEILDPGKAACAVVPERRDVAGFCLNRQADGPRGGSRLADGANQCPRHPPRRLAPGTTYRSRSCYEQPSRKDAGCATAVARLTGSSPRVSGEDSGPGILHLLQRREAIRVYWRATSDSVT